MTTVFIIHAKANDTIATRLHFALSLAGIGNWVDHIHTTAQDVQAATESTDALQHSEIGLLILSEETVLSRKCKHQWESILDQGKRLVVAIAQPFPPDDLPERLWDYAIPYIDLSGDLHEGIGDLIRAIAGETSI
jgi:hypothetical protein